MVDSDSLRGAPPQGKPLERRIINDTGRNEEIGEINKEARRNAVFFKLFVNCGASQKNSGDVS